MTYLQLRRAFRQEGLLSSVLLPLCLRYPHVGRTHESVPHWKPGGELELFFFDGRRLKSPSPRRLPPERLKTFDFGTRLNNTVIRRRVPLVYGGAQHTVQRWDNINNGRVLQTLVSAGLFFLRAGLACLRCDAIGPPGGTS